jgi:hypothetical protein
VNSSRSEGGYDVRISLATYGSALDGLSSQSYAEREKLAQREQRDALQKVKTRGELKSLH